MSKFCTKCGKKLEEGQICDCRNNPSKVANIATKDIDINEGVNNYINIVKGIFTKPSDIIKEYAKADNFVLGIIAIIINCIISGLCLYFIIDKAFGGLLGLFGGYNSLLTGNYSLPFGKIFFMGLFCMAVWFAICALIIFVGANPILKDKMSIKDSFALVGVCSIFTTLTTLCALIFSFISAKFSIIILLLGALFYLTYLYQGLSDITSINKNRLVYVYTFAVGIATFLMIEVVPRLFM